MLFPFFQVVIFISLIIKTALSMLTVTVERIMSDERLRGPKSASKERVEFSFKSK